MTLKLVPIRTSQHGYQKNDPIPRLGIGKTGTLNLNPAAQVLLGVPREAGAKISLAFSREEKDPGNVFLEVVQPAADDSLKIYVDRVPGPGDRHQPRATIKSKLMCTILREISGNQETTRYRANIGVGIRIPGGTRIVYPVLTPPGPGPKNSKYGV